MELLGEAWEVGLPQHSFNASIENTDGPNQNHYAIGTIQPDPWGRPSPYEALRLYHGTNTVHNAPNDTAVMPQHLRQRNPIPYPNIRMKTKHLLPSLYPIKSASSGDEYPTQSQS